MIEKNSEETLAIMDDGSLLSLESLLKKRLLGTKTDAKRRPLEDELCYVQREILIRADRSAAAARYNTEQKQNEQE